MNITVKPSPKVLAKFNVFCNALADETGTLPNGMEDLVDEGLVERIPVEPGYRLTPHGEALRAAREE